MTSRTLFPLLVHNLFGRRLAVMPGLLLLLLGILPSQPMAAEIENLSLSQKDHEQVLRIDMNEAAEYQVFELDGPPRLILNFPSSHLAKNLEPIKGSDGVGSVFPVEDQHGARIEISLDQKMQHRISEKGNSLLVHLAGKPRAGQSLSKAAVLKDIEVKDRDGATELILRGDHLDASHNAFLANDKKSLVLDFWGADSKLPKDHYSFASEMIRDVLVGGAEGRVRLVVSLVPAAELNHQIESNPHTMVVRIGRNLVARKAGGITVENVSFEPDDRIAHLIVQTDKTDPVVSLREKDGAIVIDVKKASLAPGQERSMDVSAFPGPVRQVDTYRTDDHVRIVARLREKVEVTSFQSGNVLTVNLEPMDMVLARKQATVTGEQVAYTGKKVSFDFKDIDIRNALKLIAEMSDLNIIMSDDVSGTLTMRLVDVPWDQALDLILASRGLGKEKEGNVMRVAPLKVLQEEHDLKLQAQEASQKLEPVVTEFITPSFANAKDIESILLKATQTGQQGTTSTGGAATTATQGGGTETSTTGSLLTQRGTVLVDERTNTLIISDTRTAVNNIKRLVRAIDKPVDQVLIEARIVEAKDTFQRDLGIRWGGFYSESGNRFTHTVSNQSQASAPGGFLVDLPAATGPGSGGTIGYSLGTISGVFNLDLELSAAEAEGKAKIISNPRVITTNLKKAEISQGDDIPFQSASANTGVNTEFKQAKLGLSVTPQITPEKGVLLQVEVTKDTPRANDLQAGGPPIISTKKVETEIYLNNGETIVLGGIYTREQETTINGVPVLKDIPLLGLLFKKKLKKDNKTELLIFITPTVLKNSKIARQVATGT